MDFGVSEFEQRTQRAQRLMNDAGLDALFLTSEPEVRYLTGFRTLFWQSPTRPWFVIVPASGKPIARHGWKIFAAGPLLMPATMG